MGTSVTLALAEDDKTRPLGFVPASDSADLQSVPTKTRKKSVVLIKKLKNFIKGTDCKSA